MTETHYIPAFTVRGPLGTEQAVCGAFVGPALQVPIYEHPTCVGCQRWIDAVTGGRETGRLVGVITPAEPWGRTV